VARGTQAVSDDLGRAHLRNARATYALTVTALVLALALAAYALLHFLERIHTVTTIIIGSVFFSYLVAPTIRTLRRRLPMWAAVLIVYAGIAIVVLALLWIGLPLIVGELRQYGSDVPLLTRQIQSGLSINGPLAAHLPDAIKNYLGTVPAQISDAVGKNGLAISSGALSVIVSTASSLVLFVLVPIVSAYAVMDADWLLGALRGLMPAAARPKLEELAHQVNTVLAGYIRGQLLVATAVGVLVALLLLALHVRYALAIGLFAGIFELVPYLGAIAGAIPGVGVALLTNGWQNALFVAIGFVAINQLSGHVLSPLIVGDTVGLRPIFVLFALLIGGELMGLRGLLIAVPVAGLIRVIIVTFVPFDSTMLPQPPLKTEKPPKTAKGQGPAKAASKS
jgi:predicted PurR-regulated permease PerM